MAGIPREAGVQQLSVHMWAWPGMPDPRGWVLTRRRWGVLSVLVDTGQHWAEGLCHAEHSAKPVLDVLTAHGRRRSAGSHLSTLWSAVEISLGAVVTLGCAVALLDGRVSGDGRGGLRLRDGVCLVGS